MGTRNQGPVVSQNSVHPVDIDQERDKEREKSAPSSHGTPNLGESAAQQAHFTHLTTYLSSPLSRSVLPNPNHVVFPKLPLGHSFIHLPPHHLRHLYFNFPLEEVEDFATILVLLLYIIMNNLWVILAVTN